MIQIYSEIGSLKKVMVHRPGNELLQLHPFHLSEMLFEDTPYLEYAQAEHDAFTNILRDSGAEVYYLRDLFSEAVENPRVREAFIEDFIRKSNIKSLSVEEKVREYYKTLNLDDFVEAVFCGIRRDNEFFTQKRTLSEQTYTDDLFIVNPMPNCYFTRDSSINIGRGVIISNMTKDYRKRESVILKYVHRYSSLYRDDPTENYMDNDLHYGIEGGDVLVLSEKTVCIGCTERTSPGAIEYVAGKLFDRGFEQIYAFELERGREAMHLDGMLTMVDYETFVYNPFLSGKVNVFRVYRGRDGVIAADGVTDTWDRVLAKALGTNTVKLIPCGNGDYITGWWDMWNLGSNVLTIRPGEVAGYDRSRVTLDLMDKAGIRVHTFCGSELSRGRGGARCMSMPIVREKL